MADCPMIFSGEMVRALWDGRKTQTRRTLKLSAAANPNGTEIPSYYDRVEVGVFKPDVDEPAIFGAMLYSASGANVLAPIRCHVGDRIWVREAHYMTDDGDNEFAIFASDADEVESHLRKVERLYRMHPSVDWSRHKKLRSPIHMPRWASRLTLTVTDVRVERLQEISAYDLFWEGFHPGKRLECGGMARDPRDDFCETWERLNGEGSWDANPFVVARTFAVTRANIDSLPKREAAW